MDYFLKSGQIDMNALSEKPIIITIYLYDDAEYSYDDRGCHFHVLTIQ